MLFFWGGLVFFTSFEAKSSVAFEYMYGSSWESNLESSSTVSPKKRESYYLSFELIDVKPISFAEGDLLLFGGLGFGEFIFESVDSYSDYLRTSVFDLHLSGKFNFKNSIYIMGFKLGGARHKITHRVTSYKKEPIGAMVELNIGIDAKYFDLIGGYRIYDVDRDQSIKGPIIGIRIII